MVFPFPSRRLRGIRHFGAISSVLIKHGLGEVVERLRGRRASKAGAVPPGLPDPVRVRKALEELGPSFIKLGQLLSTRGDILPPEYVEELSKLQDRVPPVPFAEIQEVIEKELGRSLNELFAHFEPSSMAAASVAQVHAARLHSGERVAVKVIRPGIHKRIRKDIELMAYFAAKIEKRFDLGQVVGAVNLVREFERTIFRELDMLVEAGNIERFAQTFADVQELCIPAVHWDFTARSVLVMAHIDGIKMDRVEEIRQAGIDPREVAMIGLRSFSRQLMQSGIFHADPHPGNTIVMYDGRVGLVDFGIVGYLDEETMLQIAHLFLGFAEHDYDLVMDAFAAAGLVDPDTMDLHSLRMDLKEVAEPFYGRSLSTIAVKDVYDQVMRLVYKYRIVLPRNLLLLLKTFIQTEALGKILGSDASLLEVTRPYARRLMERGYEARKIFKNMGREARAAGLHLRGMPKLAHDALKRMAMGEHRVELRHGGLDPLSGKLEKVLNRMIVGLVLSASIIAAALILNATHQTLMFEIDLFGVQIVSLTQLLGLTGYSIATILGLWLIYSIMRSGKL
ncbi:ABC1 kinase family protein [Desulfatitalea alkaliphila]|uniref:AarF/UbiB family protein n=1 Tax=Desulfatitalea alkaliphila TaxID=2929485 RepID=A0AA41R2A5_9BACT|nr:AarF/UbiB family protein [Desulfatitalea alkaliphila]MCJ8499565.1 AarF/UbiB family protein [Desulfatitalea alkaliphila]